MTDMKQDVDAANRMRKGSLYSFIAFLSASALLAIGCVLFGDFRGFVMKVLITTSVITVASICSLCCSVHAGRTANFLPGVAGIFLAGVSATMLILGVWTRMHPVGYWKTSGIVGVFAVAFAHSLLLLAIGLRRTHRWLRLAAAINIFALAGLISFMILNEIDDDMGVFRLLIVLAILAALETLVIPILARMAKVRPTQARQTLSLTKREDGSFEDERGQLYEVNEMANKPNARDSS